MKYPYVDPQFQETYNVGYWKLDRSDMTIHISTFLQQQLGINKEKITVRELEQYIPSRLHPILTRIETELVYNNKTELLLPILLGSNLKWVKVLRSSHDNFFFRGTAHIHEREKNRTNCTKWLRKIQSFTNTLHGIPQKVSSEKKLELILREFITQIDCDRVYLFCLGNEKRLFSCISEVQRQRLKVKKIKGISIQESQIKSIINRLGIDHYFSFSNIESAPIAPEEEKLLREFGVKAVQICDIRIQNKLIGYIVCDHTLRTRVWTDKDAQWFKVMTKLSNMILTPMLESIIKSNSQVGQNKLSYQPAIHQLQDINTYKAHILANICKFHRLGIFTYNLKDQSIVTNEQWQENLGLVNFQGNFHTEVIRKIIPPNDFNHIVHIFHQLTVGEIEQSTYQYKIIVDQQVRWIESFAYIIKHKQVPIEICIINSDITRQKNIELKEQSLDKQIIEVNAFKSSIITNISHEIRTPLNTIVNLSDQLADVDSDEERELYVSMIRKSNSQLLNFIENLFHISDITSDSFRINCTEFNLNDLCHEVAQKFTPILNSECKINIIPDDNHSTIYHDREKFRSIIYRLISNSVKFTKTGEILVSYRIHRNILRLSVEDTGTGISSQQMKKIFDEFVKIQNFTPGNGLSLYVCKSLVKKMGGTIGVSSRKGVGSKFWIRLSMIQNNANNSLIINNK